MKTVAALLALFTAFGLLNRSTGSETNHVRYENRFERPSAELRTGDIVVRSGKGFISEMFRKFNLSGDSWSHAGILVKENHEMMVYHIMGDAQELNNGIRKEPLSSFCNSRLNTGYAVYRYNLTSEKEIMIRHHLGYLAGTGVRFDHHFNLSDDVYMYCTELVYKTMLRAGVSGIPVSAMNGEKFIPIDNLYRNSLSRKITEIYY